METQTCATVAVAYITRAAAKLNTQENVMNKIIELLQVGWMGLAFAGVLFVAAGLRTLHQAKSEGPGKWTGVAGLGLVTGGLFLIFPPLALVAGAAYCVYKLKS
jgi:hypothetical protein